jgi:hypothetical protein
MSWRKIAETLQMPMNTVYRRVPGLFGKPSKGALTANGLPFDKQVFPHTWTAGSSRKLGAVGPRPRSKSSSFSPAPRGDYD